MVMCGIRKDNVISPSDRSFDKGAGLFDKGAGLFDKGAGLSGKGALSDDVELEAGTAREVR